MIPCLGADTVPVSQVGQSTEDKLFLCSDSLAPPMYKISKNHMQSPQLHGGQSICYSKVFFCFFYVAQTGFRI